MTLRAERQGVMRNTYSDSYIGVGMRAGLGGLVVEGFDGASVKQGFASGFDICYMGDFGRHYGFLIGLNFNFLSSGVDIDAVSSEFSDEVELGMGNGGFIVGTAHFTGSTQSVKETYTSSFLEIPIMFTYTSDANTFINLGLKFAVPLSLKATYRCKTSDLIMDYVETTGTDILPLNYRVSQYDDESGSYTFYGSGGKMRSLTVMAALEMGFRIQFLRNSSLQFSIYGDYALGSLSINNAASDMLLTMENERVNYRGVLNAGDVVGLRYFKYGIRMQYNIGIGSPRSGKPISIL